MTTIGTQTTTEMNRMITAVVAASTAHGDGHFVEQSIAHLRRIDSPKSKALADFAQATYDFATADDVKHLAARSQTTTRR